MAREELPPLLVDPDLPKDLEEVDGATRVLKFEEERTEVFSLGRKCQRYFVIGIWDVSCDVAGLEGE